MPLPWFIKKVTRSVSGVALKKYIIILHTSKYNLNLNCHCNQFCVYLKKVTRNVLEYIIFLRNSQICN